MITRRELLKDGFITAASCAISGCVTRTLGKAPAIAGDFIWGALLHLGSNMWRDWVPDAHYPQSVEEEAQMIANGKLKFETSHLYAQRDYFSTDWACWKRQLEEARNGGLNTIFIDIGEAYAYPSHPELHVRGSLDWDRMRKVIEEIRKMGMEPIPKLNFSTGHDQWLREYHYMTSTPTYYRVVADVIRDTCEVFDNPRYFHIGFDEEIPVACKHRQLCVMRHKNLWWKDCLFAVKEVEKHGARAMMWSDKLCGGREEFLKRMPKTVLQIPWYYEKDFSNKKLTWKPEFEKSQDWSIQQNLGASIIVLAEAGYDILPCTSNFFNEAAVEPMIAFCKQRFGTTGIKGLMVAPWFKPVHEDMPKMLKGIKLFTDAKRKYYI